MKAKKILASLLAIAMIATLIPFAAFAEDEVDTSFVFGTGTYGTFNYDTNTSSYGKLLGGIGGKADDDLALVFNYESDEPLPNDKRWQYPTTHIEDVGTSGGSKGVYFEFNIYADGNATARVGCGNGNIFLWAPDGTVTIPQHSGTNATTYLERGKWHKVCLSLNESNGGRYGVFFDGTLASADANRWSSFASKSSMYFSIEKNSTNGIVAYDDPSYTVWTGSTEKYSKTQDYVNDKLSVTNNNNIELDALTNAITIKKYIPDLDVFEERLAEICNNEAEIRFLNADMSAEATSVADAKIALIKTVNDAYCYYTINEYVMTNLEKVGLEKVANDNSTASDNWIDNIKIIENSKIAVYSSLIRNLSTVSSARLNKAFISNNGYEMVYVDADKNVATVDSVTDGYIKASKEGEEDIYIEIISKANYQGPFDVTAGVLDQRKSTLTNATGVAGKNADDISYGFTNASADWMHPKYAFSLMDEITNNPDGTRTYVFNMYADGDAVAQIAFSGLNSSNTDNSYYYAMKWDASTGDFYAPKSNNSISSTPTHYLEPGQWHQVAITYDRGTNGGLEIHLDGNLISTDFNWNKYNGIGLGILNTEPTGRVLYDDVEIYNGFYDKKGSIVAAKASKDDFVLDTVEDVIYYDNMDVAGLKAAVLANTDASAVEVYTDSTLATVATELTEDSVVFATTANGFRYEHFTLKSIDEVPAPEFTFEPSTHVITVKTKFIQAKKDMVLYLATYTDDKTLANIELLPVSASEINKEISLKAAYGTDGVKTVKAFLWYNGIQPMAVGEIAVDLSTPEEAE